MASNSGSRKRQQRSKSGIQNKVSHTDNNQRNREQSNTSQRQQSGQSGHKNSQHHHPQQTQKQQQQQQQQQRQQACASTKNASEAGTIPPLGAHSLIMTKTDNAKDCDGLVQEKVQRGGGMNREKQKIASLHNAVFSRRYDTVEDLLKNGVPPSETDQHGNTALTTACRTGDVRLMRTILTVAGSALDMQHANNEGETALHVCAKAGQEECCKLLLSHGAKVHVKDRAGDTPLHLAARGDHVSACHCLLNSLMAASSSETNGGLPPAQCILERNGKNQTPICLSVLHNHSEVTRMLLESLLQQQQANYLNKSLQSLLSPTHLISGFKTVASTATGQENVEVFLHGLLVSMSVLLIRLAERRHRESHQTNPTALFPNNPNRLEHFLVNSDTIHSLVRIACINHVNQQIVAIASFLIVYLMEGMAEQDLVYPHNHNNLPLKGASIANDATSDLGKGAAPATATNFIDRFIQCCGPDSLLLRLNDIEVGDASHAKITMAIAIPVVFLARSLAGRSWLESNKSHLTFLKELIYQNSSALALLTSTCPLLELPLLESTCVEFIKLVEILEDRDREKNLAELLWEEERDRMRRERKKQKRTQKKQLIGQQLANEISSLQTQSPEVSSEEENGLPCIDNNMPSNEHVQKGTWKQNVSLLHGDETFYDKSNSSKDDDLATVTINKDPAFTLSGFFPELDEHADELKKTSRNEESLKLKPTDFPTILKDGAPKSSRDETTEKGERQQTLTGEVRFHDAFRYKDAKSKCTGAISKEMRWADVAKLGCQSAENKEPYHGQDNNWDSMYKIAVSKASICDISATNCFKDFAGYNDVDKTDGQSSGSDLKQEAAARTISKMDDEWFQGVSENRGGTNSDEECIASSSSSCESRSSLLSDSYLHTRRRIALTKPIPLSADQEQHINTYNKQKTTADDLNPCPSLPESRKRKNRKTVKKIKNENASDSSTHSRLADSSSVSKNQFAPTLSTDSDIKIGTKKAKTTFKLPGVGGSLLRSRSVEVLADSSWIPVEKNIVVGLKGEEKAIHPLKTPRTAKIDSNEIFPSLYRPELPSVLPPLKKKENVDTGKLRTLDNSVNSTTTFPKRTEKQGGNPDEKGIATNVTNQTSFLINQIPLVNLKTRSSFLDSSWDQTNSIASNKKDEASISSSQLLFWSDLSKLIPTPPTTTLAPSPFSLLPIPGQQTIHNNQAAPLTAPNTPNTAHPPLSLSTPGPAIYTNPRTPPPPGFRTMEPDMLPNSQNIDDKTETGRSRVNIATKIGSIFSKGRVIATVLLDKVKNPPPALQRNQVPPLSTLASIQTWNKLLQPKKKTVIATPEPDCTYLKDVIRTSRDPSSSCFVPTVSTTSPVTPTISTLAPRDLSRPVGYNSAIPSNHCTPYSGGNLQGYPNDRTNFSSLLMNRMQQRRHSRDPFGILDMTKVTACGIERISSFKEQVSQPSKTNIRTYHISSEIQRNDSLFNHNQQNSQHSLDYQDKNQQHSHGRCLHRDPEGMPDNGQETRHFETTEIHANPCGDLVAGLRRDRTDVAATGTRKTSNTNLQENQGPIRPAADHRDSSPPVIFPEAIREDETTACGNKASFPAFHDVQTSDFLSEMFSDPLFSDKIAINQIRQKIISNHAQQSVHPDAAAHCSPGSEIDLDYYASLYRMKFRDVLIPLPGQSQSSLKANRESTLTSGTKGINAVPTFKDGQAWQNKNNQIFEVGAPSGNGNAMDSKPSWQPSSRWRPTLQKLLDLPWTMRSQYEDIVLPHSTPDFSIGVAGNVVICLGFLMDGTEVAVFMLDKACEHMPPRMVEVFSDPEMDKHFLARCKSSSESSDVHYLAIHLFEYTLCEYLQICLPTCNQNAPVCVGLVWQLLQALSFLHQGLGIPHGCLAPCWVFINTDGNVRLAGFGIETSCTSEGKSDSDTSSAMNSQLFEYHPASRWLANEDTTNERRTSSFSGDVHAAGMLAYFILSRGQYQFGANILETEIGLMRDRLGPEAFDLIFPMLTSDPKSRPTVDYCLKHPIFWSGDKKFRLILIVGSDVLTEMKTGVALTGSGAPTMMEILSMVDINIVSPNWIHEVDGTVLKEMRSFRVYKNNLAELTLFVYNCCLHFDKLSNVAKEVLDDPCKYFQNLFPSLFMAIFRSLKASDRVDRTCYKPFF